MDVEALERTIEEGMLAGHVPGLALAVVKDREVVYARGFGVTNAEEGGQPVTADTLFRIASTTKPLTGTAIMRLVEAGVLDLDCPIREYVDWLTLSQPEAAAVITLRMLLSHMSGMATDLLYAGSRDAGALEGYVRERIPTRALVLPPETAWLYSNAGVNLAGYIAEAVSGKRFSTLVRELVCEPLEMRRTTFDPLLAMTYPFALEHELADDGALRVRHRFIHHPAFDPSAGVMSTVHDLAKFAIMVLNGGRAGDQQVLGRDSLRTMLTPRVSLYTLKEERYGLTFALETYKGTTLVRHNGGLGAYGCQMYLAPGAGAGVVLCASRMAPTVGRIVYDVFDQLLDLPARVGAPPLIEPERSHWPRYVGRYAGIYTGLATIAERADVLTLDLNGTALRLEPLRQNVYVGRQADGEPATTVGFVPRGDGPAPCIVVNDSPCVRWEQGDSRRYDPNGWAAFAGTYTPQPAEADYGDTLTIRVQDGAIFVRSERGRREVAAVALDARTLACDLGLIEAALGEDGAATLELGKYLTLTRQSGGGPAEL